MTCSEIKYENIFDEKVIIVPEGGQDLKSDGKWKGMMVALLNIIPVLPNEPYREVAIKVEDCLSKSFSSFNQPSSGHSCMKVN